ncbi:sulfotransferase [Flammeovirga sp. SJP92]|uniref:sulfotransferase family protein n=1 Tax=Flammeovirga sp. SJP92 TaxID=1775430 RepID=UPI0007891C72|nr:sulfotransferase [Flammeovirga sp. SJP92]KXX70418.1 hypothetical protein AVL50_09060 [Flammeovirga sp. SJP92]
MINVNKKKIDFVVVGAQKAGTTALDRYLRKHEGIKMPFRKELHHFDNDSTFKYYPHFYRNFVYHKNFKPFKDLSKKYGEITPIYMYWDNCMERLKRYNSELKIIAILRNPIERAFSHWNMEYDRGNEKRSFNDAILDERSKIVESNYVKDRVTSYLDRGFYSRQVEEIFSLFKKEQVLFIKYETFKTDQEFQLRNIFDFLGVDSDSYFFEKKIVHERKKHSFVEPSIRNMLIELYQEDISKLEATLMWDCNDWKV